MTALFGRSIKHMKSAGSSQCKKKTRYNLLVQVMHFSALLFTFIPPDPWTKKLLGFFQTFIRIYKWKFKIFVKMLSLQ